MDTIDLHIHSTASDGTDAPAVILEKCAALGLRAVSITDHDTVAGVREAMEAGQRLGVEVIPGIEVSSDYRDNNVHILGYFIDTDSPALRPVLNWVRKEREERNRKILARFAADGYDISLEQLRREYPNAVLGRPHMAEHLMRKGYVRSVREAFDRLLGEGMPYYLPKRRISIARAVEVILAAGGVPVLAHPFQYRYPLDEVEDMIDDAQRLGIQGMECYYSLHVPEEQTWLLDQARRRGLCVSGGSDYHGTRKPHISLGTGTGLMRVPYENLEELKKRRG